MWASLAAPHARGSVEPWAVRKMARAPCCAAPPPQPVCLRAAILRWARSAKRRQEPERVSWKLQTVLASMFRVVHVRLRVVFLPRRCLCIVAYGSCSRTVCAVSLRVWLFSCHTVAVRVSARLRVRNFARAGGTPPHCRPLHAAPLPIRVRGTLLSLLLQTPFDLRAAARGGAVVSGRGLRGLCIRGCAGVAELCACANVAVAWLGVC
jgi:hypothetical protein